MHAEFSIALRSIPGISADKKNCVIGGSVNELELHLEDVLRLTDRAAPADNSLAIFCDDEFRIRWCQR